MALYAVYRRGFRGEDNRYYRYGRLMKSFTSAMKLSNKYPKSYVQAVGGADNGNIVHISEKVA